MTDKPISMICGTANTVAEKGLPVSDQNLKRNSTYYTMTTDQKREMALKALHHACRGLFGCSCHATPEPSHNERVLRDAPV